MQALNKDQIKRNISQTGEAILLPLTLNGPHMAGQTMQTCWAVPYRYAGTEERDATQVGGVVWSEYLVAGGGMVVSGSMRRSNLGGSASDFEGRHSCRQ